MLDAVICLSYTASGGVMRKREGREEQERTQIKSLGRKVGVYLRHWPMRQRLGPILVVPIGHFGQPCHCASAESQPGNGFPLRIRVHLSRAS